MTCRAQHNPNYLVVQELHEFGFYSKPDPAETPKVGTIYDQRQIRSRMSRAIVRGWI